ncbi:HAD family phosphatase [bacterium]|nr:HAD family phosphatase [bacterium]
MNPIKAVIFDMDGVLIDAKDWHYEALNRSLNHFGFNISRYDHLVTFDGLPTRKKLEMLSREHGLPISLHGFLNDLKQIYTTEVVHARCKPLFQHEYALSNLKSMGYKMAVASNSVRNSIELMMHKSNLSQYLEGIVSNQDVKHGKPDPEIYVKAMAMLGVKPEETLVLEDNEHGIASARAAGTHLMIISEVTDVTLEGIMDHIRIAEGRDA